MFKNFLKILSTALPIFAAAQETVPMYQQYLLGGEFLINPAHFGKSDNIVVNANYQKQFTKFSESPNIQTIGLHANIVDRVGAGAYFFRDDNGPVSANGVAAGLSYFIPLSDDEDRQDQFSFGISANLYNQNYDFSQLNVNDPNDPLLYENKNSIFLAYTNIGVQITYGGFFGGASVADIALSNNEPIVNGIEPSPTRYYLNAGYQIPVADGFDVSPSVLLNLNTNSSRILDINLMADIYGEQNMFSLGASFRSSKNPFGNETLSLSPIIKFKLSRLHVGAVYNLGLSNVAEYGGGGFMLSLGYDIENFINGNGFRY